MALGRVIYEKESEQQALQGMLKMLGIAYKNNMIGRNLYTAYTDLIGDLLVIEGESRGISLKNLDKGMKRLSTLQEMINNHRDLPKKFKEAEIAFEYPQAFAIKLSVLEGAIRRDLGEIRPVYVQTIRAPHSRS